MRARRSTRRQSSIRKEFERVSCVGLAYFIAGMITFFVGFHAYNHGPTNVSGILLGMLAGLLIGTLAGICLGLSLASFGFELFCNGPARETNINVDNGGRVDLELGIGPSNNANRMQQGQWMKERFGKES